MNSVESQCALLSVRDKSTLQAIQIVKELKVLCGFIDFTFGVIRAAHASSIDRIRGATYPFKF